MKERITMPTLKAQKQAARQEAREMLLKYLKPGDTVFTVLRHVSKSGMSRQIDFFKLLNGRQHYLTGYIATLLDMKRTDQGALKVSGCGMDMGFSVVYNLSRSLWPKGFKLAKGQRGRNGDTSGFDTDGGYAISQQWL